MTGNVEAHPPKRGAEDFAAFIERTNRVAAVLEDTRGILANLNRLAEA